MKLLYKKEVSHYKNLIGLVFGWALYLIYSIRNNHEVEEQERLGKVCISCVF